MNRMAGAPDPTAGGNTNTEENHWHLDEAEAGEQVREYLAQQNVNPHSANRYLTAMFAKVSKGQNNTNYSYLFKPSTCLMFDYAKFHFNLLGTRAVMCQ